MGIQSNVGLTMSDQESALAGVAKQRRERTTMEAAPRSDPSLNGLVERAVQTLKGQSRTMKEAMSKSLGTTMSTKESFFPWLIEHAADAWNKSHVGHDGKTAYERLKGKKCSGVF